MLQLNEIISNISIVNKNLKEDVTLVLATKTQPQSLLQELAEKENNLIFGENRVQEFREKYFEKEGLTWHYIGQLQANKVKYLIGKVALIHSLDKLSVADEIERLAKKNNLTINVLVEVNIAREEQRGGVLPQHLENFLVQLRNYPHICVKGLMCVYPNVEDGQLIPYCEEMRKIFIDAKTLNGDNIDISVLSAGMSKDYKMAEQYGSTMVRLGSSIFGPRN